MTSSASVNYATNDGAGLTNCNVFNGIASPRCDYENTQGTMNFAAGETSKSFSVAIVDRKSTRLNSSHANISYAVFCLKKKNKYRASEHDAIRDYPHAMPRCSPRRAQAWA